MDITALGAALWTHPLADLPEFVCESVANLADAPADALARAVLAGDGDAAIRILRAGIETHAIDMAAPSTLEFQIERLRTVYGPALKVAA